MAPVPTIARTVIYKLSPADAGKINRRYIDAKEHIDAHRARANGVQIHFGNPVLAGDEYPMVIVKVWGSEPDSAVNGKVLLDGNDDFWATSVQVGTAEGTWRWPQIGQAGQITGGTQQAQRATA